MITKDSETKKVAIVMVGIGLICIAFGLLNSCGVAYYPSVYEVVGATGPAGATGAHGYSLVATTTPDVSGSCANGGNVILMAQDTNRTGQWAPNDLDQSSTLVCNGLNGAQGTTGATGGTGSQGVQGQSGTNATPVTIVQFCSGYTTTYPSSFPEFGLCISNNIYAVYWNGSAWLAEVVPGYYESTSTSAPCNFTVNANCQVSN